MRAFQFVLLFALLLSVPAAASEWVPLMPGAAEGSPPEINILSCDANLTHVEIILPGFFVQETSEGDLLSVPGWSWTQDVGLPFVPAGSFILALPSGESVRIEAAGNGDHVFKRFNIQPTPEPEKDGPKASPAPEPEAWQGDYPSEGAVQGEAGYMAALPVSAFRVHPFRVDGETGQLTVSSHMNVKVHHDHGSSTWPLVTLSDRMTLRCQGVVANFGFVPHAPAQSRGTVQYLIITTSALQPAAQPLADWRQKSGYETRIEVLSSPNQQVVKNTILQYADLEYVLIVGDHGDIPMANWSYTLGDHWYACTTGGSNPDLFADLSIGRLSSTNPSRITKHVNKVLDYEKSPPLNDWLIHTVLVSHKEQYPDKYTKCKNEIAASMAAGTTWDVTKCHGAESGNTNAKVSQLINDGVNLLNYRGHGGPQEWWSWNYIGESYTNSDVQALTNGDMRTIVFNIACDCGDITGYCMCEAWMDEDGGAVAALGATEPSYTIPNHDFDKKLYEAIFAQDITDIGGALDYADDFIIQNHGSLGQTNAKMYIWLGDPAMRVWRVVPDVLDAAYATTIPAGSQNFDVYVSSGGNPVEDAQVCAYLEHEVFEIGTTGADGKVSLYISPLSPAQMSVTVTHMEYLPHEGTVLAGGGSLYFDVNTISARYGGTVNFTLLADAANANRNYILLGSASGTSPGTVLPGGMATLPLNIDPFTNLVMSLINTPIFLNFLGTLDNNGEGSAQLNAGPVSPDLVGMMLDFAYALNGPWDFASNPVAIKIVE